MTPALLIDSLEFGGSESVLQRLALALARRGHRVFIYCLRHVAAPTTDLERAGVTIRELRARRAAVADLGHLARMLRRDGVDIVHAHCCAALVWALPAARLLGLPVIHVWHGWPPGPLSRTTRLARALDRFAAQVAINTETLRPRLPAASAARAVCIPNGLDAPPGDRAAARRALERLCGRPLGGPLLLSVANVRVEKDQRGLLRALALLRRSRPDVQLVNVGLHQEAPYWEAVQRDLEELRLQAVAHFPGPCPEAWRLCAGADLFVLASTREAMPNAVLEAMSQKVPIVATAVGEVGRLGSAPGPALLQDPDTALLVPPGRPDALAGALAAALADPASAAARAERAYAHHQRQYTADRMAERYEALYRSASGTAHRRVCPPVRRAPSRPAVVMIGPPPSAIGGMVTSVNVLMAGPLRESFALFRHATPPATEPTPAGSPRAARAARLARSLARHAASLGRLAHLLARHRIRLVHIHTCSHATFWRNLADILVARLMHRRIVLHIRGGRFAEFCAARGTAGRWLVRRGLAAADAIIVLSETWRTALRPFTGAATVHAIPNAVVVPPAPKRAPDRRRGAPCRFLYLAPLTHAKGLRDLLAAAALLLRDEVRFELTVAGPAPEEPQAWWAAQAEELGLAGRVRFVGPVNATQRTALFRAADAFVHSSHVEALPNAVLEAAAAGLPVVATAVGSLPEVLASVTGEPVTPLVPPRAPEALAAEMRRLAGHARLRRTVAERLRTQVANQCGVERVSAFIGAVYRAVLADGARPDNAVARRSLGEQLVRSLAYPLHERLRGRPTLAVQRAFAGVAAAGPRDVKRLAAGRLAELLRFAGATLPYYRALFAARGVSPDGRDPRAELAKLPVLTKAEVRSHAEELTWRGVPGGLHPCSSGGTSGDTLHLFIDRLRQAQDRGARLWAQSQFGVRPGDRRAWLWGAPLEARASQVRKVRDRLLNELLLDAFDLSEPQLERYLAHIRAFRPRVIYGYTSALTLLARYAAARCGPDAFPGLRLVVLTGEEITAEQRALVRRAFGAAVASEYGNREVGLIAHECPAGRLHVLEPHIHVEVVADGQPLPDGACGEIVCTNLQSRAQPLLRYRVGDLGRWTGERCPCGVPLPVLELLGGKISGFLALPDGRLCHGAVSSHAIQALPGIVSFRTHQRELDRVEILLVTDASFRNDSLEQIRQRYRRLLGPQVRVEIRIVDRIPPDPSGKRRHFISDVSPDLRRFEVCTD